MQKAGKEIKTIVSDPELLAQQPNNVGYVKDYYKQATGFSESKAIAGLEDTLHNVGISPKEVRNVLGDVKSAWIGQKLLASAGFTLANFMQASATLPHMADLMVKYGGNPLAGIAGGMSGVMFLATNHMADTYAKNSTAWARKTSKVMSSEFMNRALKYAEDNGVVSRSTYDESPIEASFSKTRRALDFVGKATITSPETILRGFAFGAFAEQLKSSGKFADDMEIFRIAEERTNAALADYRAAERPILFNKLGMVGDLASTLQTFPVNFYNQWSWATREARRGNVAPALTMLITQYTIAGAMGLPGMQDLDKAYEWVKKWAAKNEPELWAKIKDYGPKQAILDNPNLGEAALYGQAAMLEMPGDIPKLAMTSRVSAPSFIDMATSGGNMIADLYKQGSNVVGLAAKPSEKQLAKTVLDSAPVGMQGALETGPLRDIVSQDVEGGRLYQKRGSTEGDFIRTPQDELARSLGVRSQREAFTKDRVYEAQQRGFQAKDATKKLLEEIFKGSSKGEDVSAKMRLYISLKGDAPTAAAFTNQKLKEMMDGVSKTQMGAKQLEAMKAAKRMQDLLDVYYPAGTQ
jgi:hypothetical protein